MEEKEKKEKKEINQFKALIVKQSLTILKKIEELEKLLAKIPEIRGELEKREKEEILFLFKTRGGNYFEARIRKKEKKSPLFLEGTGFVDFPFPNLKDR
jgi:hypothetical protein